MKLLAAPLVVSILRQTHYSDLFQCPIVGVRPFPFPLPVTHRIAKRAPVRRANLPTVVKIQICVVVAFSTRRQRRLRGLKLRTPVFSMAGDAPYSRRGVRFNYSGDKSVCVMTLRAVLFHGSGKRVAGGAGASISFRRYGWLDTQVRLSV